MHNPFSTYFNLSKNFNTAQSTALSSCHIPQDIIYMDYAASTPVDNRVYEAMKPWHLTFCGSSSNIIHAMGEYSRHGLENAREQLKKYLGQHDSQIIFTSSATESNNLLLRGIIEHPLQKRTKIVYSPTEHSSIYSTIKSIEENIGKRLGFEFQQLPIDDKGQIIIEKAKKIIDSKTLYVFIMDVNNETGIINVALPELEKHIHSVGAYLHVDCVQGLARNHQIALGVDYDSAVFSSSKIYGPKGAAALVLKKRRPRIYCSPQLTGGGQEFGMRSSTPNLPAIIGFIKAFELQLSQSEERIKYFHLLENAFLEEVKKHSEPIFYGLDTEKVPGILTLSFPNVNGMKLLENTPLVCASVGSACKTLQATASHVLTSMGIEIEQALASFRISFGLPNTVEEAKRAAVLLSHSAQLISENSANLT